VEDLWLRHAKKLHALASTGASFTKDPYDKERYDEIAQIAVEMLAQLGSVPVQRIKDLIGPYAAGYVTPKVDIRGVVFHANQILLVKESTDGKWALPGGFADIGLSPAENIAKEILEEAGIEVKVQALIGIRHKPKASYAPDAREFYKLFFGCETIRRVNVRPDAGIAGWGYFGQNDIPDLSTGRTIAADIDMAFAYRLNGQTMAFFE
jgi:ADP-ribose pyrophosphatase YjhB (NUDIX family)